MDEITPVEGERTEVGPAKASSRMPDRLRKGAGKRPATTEGRRPYLSEAPAQQTSPADEARQAASDLVSFFRSLARADRWAAGSTSLLLLMLGFPWRWTKEDEEIIGVVAAWPVLLLASAALVLIYLRARAADAAQDRTLRLAQLAASGGAAVLIGLFLPWATQVESQPLFGAYAGLLCASAALVAALPALRDR